MNPPRVVMRMKEKSKKAGLKFNIQNTKFMASKWGNKENSDRFYFLVLQK